MLKGKVTQANDIFGTVSSNAKLLNHEMLYNRDSEAAHPIDSIEGLADKLNVLDKVDKRLTKQIQDQENAILIAVSEETERADKVETYLELEINKLNQKLNSIDTESVTQQYNTLQEAIRDESIERLKTDSQLSSKVTTLAEDLANVKNAFNKSLDQLLLDITVINDAIESDRASFDSYAHSVDEQAIKLDQLVNQFKDHLKLFEEHITSNSGNSETVEMLINELDLKLSNEISNKIKIERQTSETELFNLNTSITQDIEQVKEQLTARFGSFTDNSAKYTDLKISEVSQNISDIEAELSNTLNSLSTDLNTKINLLEALLTTVDTRLIAMTEEFNASDETFSDRIDMANDTIDLLADEVKEHVRSFNEIIKDIYYKLADTANNIQDIKLNLENQVKDLSIEFSIKINEHSNKISEDINVLSQSITSDITNLNTELTNSIARLDRDIASERNQRRSAIDSLDQYYQDANANIRNSYVEADSKVLTDSQNFTTEAIKPLTTRLDEIDSWKATVANVMDFIGITTTDITAEAYKKFKIVKIGEINYEANKGDVVLYNSKEYVWTGDEPEELGWEEFGIGTANAAAIAELQNVVGINGESPSGIFKLIADNNVTLNNQIVNETAERKAEIQSLQNSVSSKIENTAALLREELIKANNKTNEDLSALSKETKSFINDANTKFENLETFINTELDNTDKKISELQTSLQSNTGELNSVNLAIGTLRAQDKDLESKINKTNESVSKLTNDFEDFKVTEFKNLKSDLTTQLGNLDNNLKSVEDSVTELDTKISNTNNSINNLSNTVSNSFTETNNTILELRADVDENNKSIENLDGKFTALSKTVQDKASELQTKIDTHTHNNYWQTPNSLIFNNKDEANSFIAANETQTYPGQLVTINTDGLLETYVLDQDKALQLISGGGGGGGTPDKVTETQYCIHVKNNDFIPQSLESFISVSDSDAYIINIPKATRKNNIINTNQLEAPGGYIYYASTLLDLKFTSGGFDAGFSNFSTFTTDTGYVYNIYRTNQKIIDAVEININ